MNESNESWVYDYDTERKIQSSQWKTPEEQRVTLR